MIICNLCENITIEEMAVVYPPNYSRYDEPPGYSHQPDWPSLLESAKTCELCRLIRDTAESQGTTPAFDPKYDVIPDQIARRNASQRLKLRASRTGMKSSGSVGMELSILAVENAQGLSVYLDILADEGLFVEFQPATS
jgi:hypothetical protein